MLHSERLTTFEHSGRVLASLKIYIYMRRCKCLTLAASSLNRLHPPMPRRLGIPGR